MQPYTVYDPITKIVQYSSDFEEQPPNSSPTPVTEDFVLARYVEETDSYELAATQEEQDAYLIQKQRAIEYAQGWAENLNLTDSETVTSLNFIYPDATGPFTVYANGIKYEKAATGNWSAYESKAILLNRLPQEPIKK